MLPGCCQWGKFLLLIWNEATGWKPVPLLVFSLGLIGITGEWNFGYPSQARGLCH